MASVHLVKQSHITSMKALLESVLGSGPYISTAMRSIGPYTLASPRGAFGGLDGFREAQASHVVQYFSTSASLQASKMFVVLCSAFFQHQGDQH